MDQAKAVFEEALKQFAPKQASEAAEILPFLRADESYLRGKKDCDLYMGWKVLNLAPQRDGEAALERLFDRMRYINSPPETQVAPPVSPKATAVAPPAPEARIIRKGAGGSVSCYEWIVENKTTGFDDPAKEELSRTYSFSSMRSPETTATLRIVCSLAASLVNNGEAVSLDRRLRFYLRPFRLPHEADFIMRFSTSDGTQGGEFDVVAGPVENDSDTALIAKYGGRSDVASCVAAIMSGKDMVFKLRDEQESLVNFGLPNDREFKRLYDETCKRLQDREVMNGVLRYNAQLQGKRR
jgi:hypothetical protein